MKILVIRACGVGDFVLNLPALQALQSCYKNATFTLVGYPSTLELARDFLDVAAVQSVDSEPWCRLFYEPIAELDFDRTVVWMKPSIVAENLRRSGLANVLHAKPFPETGHASSHLLQTLSLPPPDLPDRWHATTDHVILHPGSGSPKKNWPHFMDLANHLAAAVFLLGPAESDYHTGRFPRLENLSLREVAGVLASSRLYVGNDSGITHLAAYLGVPTIALFGPTDPAVWGPIGRRAQVLVNATLADVTSEAAVQTN